MNHLITGAASGIGRHVAEQLIARGDKVFAVDINIQGLSGFEHSASLDIRSAEQWQAVYAQAEQAMGEIDVLMNVAGVFRSGYGWEISEDDIDFHMDINVKGLILGTMAALKRMKPRGKGHIINVASLAGITPVPGFSLYSASKHAARAFSLSVAAELMDTDIAVTAVCPDAVQTPMLDIQKDDEHAALTFSGGRVLAVEDVTNVIINKVLTQRPPEVMIPVSRGLLAKAGGAAPGMHRQLLGSLRKKGLKTQQAIRQSEKETG